MTNADRLVHEFQQPPWPDAARVAAVETELARRNPVADVPDILALDAALERVRRGDAFTIQLGDCAERFSPRGVQNSLALAELAAETSRRIRERSSLAGVSIVRTAGQFAKPRSKAYEELGSGRTPVFRGHIVNDRGESATDRRPDPTRMLTAHRQASRSINALTEAQDQDRTVWVGHEAMLLPYERGLLRTVDGERYGTSAHFLWIGDRTRQLDSPIVDLLGSVANPVGCKIGPSADPSEMAHTVALLRRRRRAVVLIVRLGVQQVEARLPRLIDGLASVADQLIWVVDPLHGNHEETAVGLRTRRLCHAMEEVDVFVSTLQDRGLHPGGLHLEATWDDVLECVDDVGDLPDPARYRSLMDPRLNPDQTARLADAFATRLSSGAPKG